LAKIISLGQPATLKARALAADKLPDTFPVGIRLTPISSEHQDHSRKRRQRGDASGSAKEIAPATDHIVLTHGHGLQRISVDRRLT
jgi:hypothetical protein